MLDIKFIRENPDIVKENIKKKFQDNKIALVDEIIEKDKKWRELKAEIDNLRAKRNKLSLEINSLKKQKKDIKALLKEAKSIPDKIAELENKTQILHNSIIEIQKEIPNIMHNSVPIGKDASENKVIKEFGNIPVFKFPVKNHVELIENLGLADFEASAEVSGKGFYYLKNELALLNQALIRFTIDFMTKKKYEYIETPLMLNEKSIYASMSKEEIKNSVYSIKGEDLNLIGTSEQSLLAMHSGDVIKEEDLPKKYFSYSMCFRKEIGSHGINEKGLWRTHQFNKIEQFIFCRPEDSYKYYNELLENSEELYKKLKIPYQVLEMCSGDLASWKAKSCDIEAYRPTTKKYEEVGSLSNCADYQAKRLNIKVLRKNGTKEVLHTLNNTAIATSRAMVVILENNQQKDGSIKIPNVLVNYMNGIKKIEPPLKRGGKLA